MKKFSIKGIIVGGCVDMIGTQILMFVLVSIMILKIRFHHVGHEQLVNSLSQEMDTSLTFKTINFLIGYGCSVLGGYVSARIAKRNELLNGALASSFCFLFGIYAITRHAVPLSMNSLFKEMTCPLLALSGGYIYLKTKKKVKSLEEMNPSINLI